MKINKNLDEVIEKCLNENGILIDNDGNMLDIDSFAFISAVIALEEEFNVEIPDMYLNYERLSNKVQIAEMIQYLIDLS